MKDSDKELLDEYYRALKAAQDMHVEQGRTVSSWAAMRRANAIRKRLPARLQRYVAKAQDV